MNLSTKPWAFVFSGVAVTLGFAIATALLAKERAMPPTNRIVSVMESTRSLCLGRFILDLPVTAQVIYGPARVPIETWRRDGEGENLEALVSAAVAKSEEDRWLARDGLTGNASMLGKVIDGVSSDHKIVLGVGRGSGSFYNVQSFVRVGKDIYIQEYEAFGEDNKYLNAVHDAKEFASRIVPRSQEIIPHESGICIDGAFIREPQRYMVEAVSIGIRLREFEDVHLSIQMTKKSRHVESDAIEPRLRSAENTLTELGYGNWYKRVKFLRRAPRKVGNWDGFEVAAHRPALDGEEESHEFSFLSHGEPKNPMLPVLDVKMHTGVKGNTIGGMMPSITDDEALYLWDTILRSIRPRTVQSLDKR